MQVVYSNVADQQKRWINEALALCSYPFHRLINTLTLSTVQGVTSCSLPHTYMCTTVADSANQAVQVESFADDPANPENAGLPDPNKDLHEFFLDSFVHELGHVVQGVMLTTGDLQQQAAQCFTHIPDGRRGSTADFDGGEGSISAWADRMQEAIAEWFRLTFLPEPQLYWNRTNWDLSPADFPKLMKLLMPSYWQYGAPIIIPATRILDEAEGDHFTDSLGEVLPLGRLAVVKGSQAFGSPILDAPDFTAGGGFPSVGVGQLISPTLFGSGPRWLGLGSAAGSFSNIDGPVDVTDQTGENVRVFNDGDFGNIIAYSPSSEPGYRAHFGYPGVDLGDPKSWSGWKVYRSVKFSIDYSSILRAMKEQGYHGWGVVQVIETGAVVHDALAGGAIQLRAGTGFHGALTSGRDGGDGGAPWGSDPTIIRPPQSGAAPNLVASQPAAGGWYAGVSQSTQILFTVLNVVGSFSAWDGVSGQVIVPPTSPRPPQPPPPSGLGSNEISHLTPTTLGVTQSKDWVVAAIEDLSRSYAFPCQPDRMLEEIGFYWQGFSAEVDDYSNFDLTVVYWPVKFITTKLPPYPARFTGYAKPGPVHSGSVRNTNAPQLARRGLQIVQRVGGSHRGEPNDTTDVKP